MVHGLKVRTERPISRVAIEFDKSQIITDLQSKLVLKNLEAQLNVLNISPSALYHL